MDARIIMLGLEAFKKLKDESGCGECMYDDGKKLCSMSVVS